MRKCRESISLHFLIFSPFPPHFLILSPFPLRFLFISSFSLHFLAAWLQGCNDSCSPGEALILVFCSCAFQSGLCVFIVNRQAGQDYSLVSSFRNCNSCNLTCGHRPFFEFHQNKSLNFDCHKKTNAHFKCKVRYKQSFHSFVKTLHGSCCETMPDDSLLFTSICHRDIFS